MKRKKTKTGRTVRPMVLVVSENDDLSSSLEKALASAGCRSRRLVSLPLLFETIRTEDIAAVVVDTVVQYVPGPEIADAVRGVAERVKVLSLRERQVGRPPKRTPGGSYVVTLDTPVDEIAALAARPGRGRRKRFVQPDKDLPSLLERPVVVSRKAFLDAADSFYLKSAIALSAVKPRLAAAVAGDSLASAYRLLEEYGIPYGLSAGARPCRKKKSAVKKRKGRKAGRRKKAAASREKTGKGTAGKARGKAAKGTTGRTRGKTRGKAVKTAKKPARKGRPGKSAS